MKIAFFSANSFGIQGSPGTYRFVERCARRFDVRVFAPLHGKRVVYSNKTVPIIPQQKLLGNVHEAAIIGSLYNFDPDIVYFFNFPNWYKLLASLKIRFPEKKFVLDIKSPLLAEGERRVSIQDGGRRYQHLLDSVITVSESNISTWIPDCNVESMVYPLGLDLSSFRRSGGHSGVPRCSSFVYAGALHAQRKLEVLIEAFSIFADEIGESVNLDIFGSGPHEDQLREMADQNGSSGRINFLGLYPQDELFEKLRLYDAGLAYVPIELFDSSPSLKSLEYMASGIGVIASNTGAHKKLNEEGFSLDYCENTKTSIVTALRRAYSDGFSKEQIRHNMELVKKYDYDTIIENYFVPFFRDLVKFQMGYCARTAEGGEGTPSKASDKKRVEHSGARTFHSRQGKRRTRILFVGPLGFRPGVWETRATYILPDLFEPLLPFADIHFLTGPVPAFAKATLNELCAKFSVRHLEFTPEKKGISREEHWLREISAAASKIHIDIMTNIFGATALGKVMSLAAKEVGARVVLRVAGDEVISRLMLGAYKENCEALVDVLANEAAGYRLADSIIVMSPLERLRIWHKLPASDRDKVKVCIRGVDLSRFPKKVRDFRSQPARSFLFVGRKSEEKGYDIIEKCAEIMYDLNQDIEFRFAGPWATEKFENRNYLGWIDDRELPAIFSESDGFILCSRTEGFPQVVSEAMATGMPCILSEDIFGDILQDGKQALLAPLDSEEICRKILRIHGDPVLANNLGAESRIYAEQNLDKEAWSDKYRRILLDPDDLSREPFPDLCLTKIDDEELESLEKVNRPFLTSSVADADEAANENILEGHHIEGENPNQLSFLFVMFPSFWEYQGISELIDVACQLRRDGAIVHFAYHNSQVAVFPDGHDLILMPFCSSETVGYQIDNLDSDVVVVVVSELGDLSIMATMRKMTRPIVVYIPERGLSQLCDADEARSDDGWSLWRNEVLLSGAVRILVGESDFSTFGSQSVMIEDRVRRKDENWRWKDVLSEVVAYGDNPGRLFQEQQAINPEHALHLRRMRERLRREGDG